MFIGEIFDAPLVDEEFDVVTMWDVLEHVRDPRATLDEVARVTRTGGFLVLSTGNVEGPLARRDLEHWDLMFPPGHLTFFSPQSLEPLLNRAGFELDRIVGDGRVSRRAGLTRPYSVAAAGAIGLGNVITVTARRVRAAERPRRRLLKARVPSELLRSSSATQEPAVEASRRRDMARDCEALFVRDLLPHADVARTGPR